MQSNYTITTDQSRFDLEAIHAYLTRSYWSPGIPIAVVARAVKNSLCFAVLQEGQQIGFARVVTDQATFAYLADVYILEAHRGKGLAQWLIAEVMRHQQLQGLRRFMLGTRDAHALYQRFGFTEIGNPARLMEKLNPNVYQSAPV